MKALQTLSCLALVGLMASGCVTHQTAKLDSASALRSASTASDSLKAGNAGVASFANGDNWTAANLFEQARTGYDSPLNRFNLAAAYASTGRSAQAATLYATVVADGQYTEANTNRLTDNQGGASSRINLADEAQRRLSIMKIQTAMSASAPSASDFGVSASAHVGGPRTGRVSDARALQLDESAEFAIGE
jgi:hypothetical protein